MRRELLKQYLFSLLAEGEFKGMSTFTSIAKKAAAMFAQDLPIVITEIVQITAESGSHRARAFVFDKIGQLLQEVDKRGVKAVWIDLQEQYRRGMEAKNSR